MLRQPRARRRALPGRYVELHVEQGPVLEAARAPLGVVTGIVGSTRRELVFEGTAGHAGTTPMDARDDALAKAAEFVLRARDAARAIDGTVATVGRLEVEPGAANVIPGRVRLTVDVRAPDEDRLTRLLETLGLEPGHDLAPVALDEGIRAVLREELERRSLAAVELPSGAGHDAGVLAVRGVETGMLFVRSLNGGISHSPDELTSDEDIALALDVLTAALRRLALGERIGCAPSQRVRRPSSRRFSCPSTSVAKWLPASGPALLPNEQWPYGKSSSVSLMPPG